MESMTTDWQVLVVKFVAESLNVIGRIDESVVGQIGQE